MEPGRAPAPDRRPSPVAVVTGAGGLIGHALVRDAVRWAPGWLVHGLARPQLDLTDFDAVCRTFHALRPSLIIHCAALSRTPDCQRQPALARRLNVPAGQNLPGQPSAVPHPSTAAAIENPPAAR